MNKKNGINTWLMILPWIIVFGVFWLYPLGYSFYMSLTDYTTLTSDMKFIGFANYAKIVKDNVFWTALSNTMIFTLGTVPVTTVIALLLALAVNSKLVKYKEFFRAGFFIPSVTSLIVISLIFTNLYAQDGYINYILRSLGLPFPAKGWLAEPSTALLSVMAMDVWSAVGYYMILFLAGMQTISNDLYDAARLCGANFWQKLFRITLPNLKSTLLFIIVINTIKSFQVFVEIFVMTKGGPLNKTTTLVYMVFENAFEKIDTMGYASALAYVVFIILLIFSFVQMKLLKIKD